MNKMIFGFIMGAMIFGSISAYATTQYIATKAEFGVFINDVEFKGTTGEVLVVDERTYLPLRDMADALNIPIDWNSELRRVEISILESSQGTRIYDKDMRRSIQESELNTNNEQTIFSKHIPSQELLNKIDGNRPIILLENGIYYIQNRYAMMRPENPDVFATHDDDTNESYVLYNGREIFRIKRLDSFPVGYLPYDDYVEKIKPIIGAGQL